MLRVTATPIIGNSHTDGPACDCSAGGTLSLWTGTYLSGCLCGLVPLRGKGIGEWLPTSVSRDPGLGWLLWLVATTSGLPCMYVCLFRYMSYNAKQ